MDKITKKNTEATETEQSTSEEEPKDWKAEAEKWRALARKTEERAKANAEKAQQFDKIQEESKTELEREREAREAAERKAQATERELLRARVAAETGVNPDFLNGDDEDSMRSFAEKLIAWRGDVKTPAPSNKASGERGEEIKSGKKFTREDLQQMSSSEIMDAYKTGSISGLSTS